MSNEQELSRRWIQESALYVSAMNDFIRRGMRLGWENVNEREEPRDSRGPMTKEVLAAVRRANQAGRIEGLHQRFPRAHGPFVELLSDNEQCLPVALMLDDARVILRIGAHYESGRLAILDDESFQYLSPEIITIGRSPNRDFFAIARSDGVAVQRGWDGPTELSLKWPTGLEGIPKGFAAERISGTSQVNRLIPFNTGDRVLLVSTTGIFVLETSRAVRLLPTESHLREHFEWLKADFPADPLSYELSMDHGAISADGKWIAAGHQSSLHLVFDAQSYEIVAEVGHSSEYPHHAAFSSDGSMIAFNSCHFYNGMTIGVPIALIPDLKTEPYQKDDRLIELDTGARVYACVSRDGEFIIGDAYGYLRAFDLNGRFRWQHYIGGTICDMDISRDGRRLVVTTYAGYLAIIDLDTGTADPFVIGTATHHERRRWIFWKQEPAPLIW